MDVILLVFQPWEWNRRAFENCGLPQWLIPFIGCPSPASVVATSRASLKYLQILHTENLSKQISCKTWQFESDYFFRQRAFPMIRSILTLLNIKILFLREPILDGKGRSSTCWICTAFLLPWSSCQQRFSLIPKDLWLYPRGRRVTAEAIKEICLLVISVLLISHLQQSHNRLECGIFALLSVYNLLELVLYCWNVSVFCLTRSAWQFLVYCMLYITYL